MGEAQLAVEIQGRGIAADHGVELQDTKAQLPGFFQAVAHQGFAQAPPSGAGSHGVAGIADMAAAAHIVGVQDIKAQELPVLFADAGKALRLEKGQSALPVQLLCLGESHPGFHHFIPYLVGGIDIRRCKGSDVHCRSPFILSVRLSID